MYTLCSVGVGWRSEDSNLNIRVNSVLLLLLVSKCNRPKTRIIWTNVKDPTKLHPSETSSFCILGMRLHLTNLFDQNEAQDVRALPPR